MTLPDLAISPSLSKGFFNNNLVAESIRVLAGPVSNASRIECSASLSITVRFAIPPKFSTMDTLSADENWILWKAWVSGAPLPPLAISAALKLLITSIPVRAATLGPSSNWIENPFSGRCLTVWPWQPTATTSSFLIPAFFISSLTAFASYSASFTLATPAFSISLSVPVQRLCSNCFSSSSKSILIESTILLLTLYWDFEDFFSFSEAEDSSFPKSTKTASMPSTLVPDISPI